MIDKKLTPRKFLADVGRFYDLGQAEEIKKAWGREYIIHNTNDYCVKAMVVFHSGVCSVHAHGEKRETFTLCSGKLEVTTINTKTGEHIVTLLENPGDSITIKPNTPHTFKVKQYEFLPCFFIESSTFDSSDDNVRYSQSTGTGLYEEDEETD